MNGFPFFINEERYFDDDGNYVPSSAKVGK